MPFHRQICPISGGGIITNGSRAGLDRGVIMVTGGPKASDVPVSVPLFLLPLRSGSGDCRPSSGHQLRELTFGLIDAGRIPRANAAISKGVNTASIKNRSATLPFQKRPRPELSLPISDDV